MQVLLLTRTCNRYLIDNVVPKPPSEAASSPEGLDGRKDHDMPYPEPFDPSSINIQEIPKNYEKEVLQLRRCLQSRRLIGRALRVLIFQLKHPEEPVEDLEVLLLLSLAEEGRL